MENTNTKIIERKKVVTIEYTLKNETGDILDQNMSLTYLHGFKNLVPGLEEALEGKKVGDTLSVAVPPEKGYGNRDENMIFSLPKENFTNGTEENKADICASFQKDLIDILLKKLVIAAKQTGIRQVAISGGVSANSGLRNRIVEEGQKRGWTTFLPEFRFTTDNAAMIAITGYFKYQQKLFAPLDIAPLSRAAEYGD